MLELSESSIARGRVSSRQPSPDAVAGALAPLAFYDRSRAISIALARRAVMAIAESAGGRAFALQCERPSVAETRSAVIGRKNTNHLVGPTHHQTADSVGACGRAHTGLKCKS